MLVADIMVADPVHVRPDTGLNEMMDLMDRHRIRHLPVVQDKKLVGIVSQRDLLSATGWLPAPPNSGLCAADVLQPDVATLSVEDSVVTLALELDLRSIGCMPVLDASRLVGIVTETDLLAAALRSLQEDPPVREIMSPTPLTVGLEATVGDAEALATRRNVRHLLVLKGRALVGILSDRDFRRSHGRQQPEDLPVERIMTPVPVVVDADAKVSEAADHLVTQRVSALPVVSGQDTLGIVSVADVLEHCENHLREGDSD